MFYQQENKWTTQKESKWDLPPKKKKIFGGANLTCFPTTLFTCSLVGKTFWQILFHKQFRFISRIGSWEGRCEMKREIKMKGYMPIGKINVGRKACQSFFCIYSRLVQPNPSLPSQPLWSIFSCCILLTIYSTHELIRPNWLCLGKIGWLGLIFFIIIDNFGCWNIFFFLGLYILF